jgi:hypothetical protein
MDAVWNALGMFRWKQQAGFVTERMSEIVHQMASDINKSKRQLSPNLAIVD